MESTLNILARIQTPFDDEIPKVEEPSARFYVDAMRIYLALSSGTISFDEGIEAAEALKKNPEYARSPTNPTQVPINQHYTNKILENLKILKKFNLFTRDSIRSAYSFVFISEEASINNIDFRVLQGIVETPRASISSLAINLGISPRTVSRSFERLKERHLLRNRAYLDNTPWGINTSLVFFTPRKDIDWPRVEEALMTFPYLKTILKTSVSDLGYLSFIVPGYKENYTSLHNSIKKLSKTIFDYVSIHTQDIVGADRNLSLYQNGIWKFPDAAKLLFENEDLPNPETTPRILTCSEDVSSFREIDYKIALAVKQSSRASPSEIARNLLRKGIDVDPKQISTVVRKLYDRSIVLPYTVFALGLTSDFCFEIVCNEFWKQRIMSVLPLLPYTMSYFSPNGVIIWAASPGVQQVEYYQLFRLLEEHSGVKSVRSLMTINMKGSRVIDDFVESWRYTRNGYSVPSEEFNLSEYLPDDL
ncbi:MAG: winged helix-turn-helix transcriptional regulator [Candidatus Thorarchaeota archaeon]